MQLPHGWSSCSLSDIAAVNPKTVADESLIAGFVPMSHAPTSYHGELLFDEKPWGEIKKSYTNFQDGDVIFAKVTPCFENGKAAIVDDLPNGIGAGSSEFYVLRPHCNNISQKLLFALIKTHAFMQEGATNMTGAVGLRRVPKSFVETFPIALPPAAEQKEIADRLDTLLAQVEATQARLARIPDIIKRFRQSVLAAAVRGRLTLNMDVEFERLTINSVCNAAFDGPFGSKLKSSDYTSDGVRVIRLENIGHLEFLSEKKTYISKEKYSELKKNEIMNNDVLFSSFVDQEVRTCLFDAVDDIYINKADCFCLRPDQNKINPKYLSFLLASRTSYEQIKEKVQGVTRPRINLKILKSLEFMIPSIAAQNEIVSQVEKLFAYADTLEQQAEAAKERVDKLTQVILAKAFRGELTADWRAANPDLISGDNSAAALLACIQAERATAKPRKRATKTSAA
ncbi:restriction endonuclease subunit S [Aeromonas sobria]|uniref:restriction endonuclease subunit S n=1 Tax=Aeromonas sobria TaxID=646 RepID=UPI003F3253D2